MKEVYDVDSIAICKFNYKNEEDFWKAVADALRVMTDNKNEVWFRYEDVGVYILTYVNSEGGGPKITVIDDSDDWDESKNDSNDEDD